MKNLAKVVTLSAFTLVSLGLSVARPVFSDEIGTDASEKILAVRASFNESIKNHDAASIAAYLDSEYQVTTSSGEHYRETPEDEAASWAEMFRDNVDIIYVRTPDLVEVSTYYDMAAENGTWVGRWSSLTGDVEMGGSYFAQWRNVNGVWKIRAEVFVGLFCNGPGCQTE
jgi:hypothetical protein